MMIDWWWPLVAVYVGVAIGMWIVITSRDGRPLGNTFIAAIWPIAVLMWLLELE